MATKIRKLLDDSGAEISPITISGAVLNENGDNLDELINRKVGFKDAIGNPSIPEIAIDLSTIDIFGNSRNTRETANSYVVSNPGGYRFPLVYGCGIKDGITNTESYTNNGGQYQADFVNYKGNQITSPYIETDTGETANSVEILISDENDCIERPFLESGYIYLDIIRIPEQGANYVIGVKDSNGIVMWSWHLWLWDQVNHPLEEVEITNYSGNTYRMLNYNLATKLDSDLTHMKNWFYQWGRKDPMLLPSSYNNATNHTHTSYGSSSFSISSIASSVSDAIKNPCTFYNYSSSYNYNWVQLDYFYNYWDATCNSTGSTEKTITKTIYDPCPPGYIIPNARVFTGFTSTGDNTSTVGQFNKIGNWANGWYFKKNFSDTEGAFFPAGGLRDYSSGSLTNVGSNGKYWSAGAYSRAYACSLYFNSGSVSPLYYSNRANGFSVRPFLE